MVRGATATVVAPPTSGPPSERYRRFLQLDRPGVTADVIARELGTSRRTVERYRSAARSPAPTPTAVIEEPPAVPATPAPLTDRQRQQLGERTLEAALTLAVMIRDQDADTCRDFVQALPHEQRDALPYILAAIVPVDQPVTRLLEWITWDEDGRPIPDARQQVAKAARKAKCVTGGETATHTTASRHRRAGQPLCVPCQQAENLHRQDLYQAKKRRTRAA
ncbi:hypothetical protein ACWCSD_40405 [Nonomuraea sp. NPDC001684]